MPIYERLVGGFTDRHDHIDTVKGHIWVQGSNPVQAKCGHAELDYKPTVHEFIPVHNASQMCDGCQAAFVGAK